MKEKADRGSSGKAHRQRGASSPQKRKFAVPDSVPWKLRGEWRNCAKEGGPEFADSEIKAQIKEMSPKQLEAARVRPTPAGSVVPASVTDSFLKLFPGQSIDNIANPKRTWDFDKKPDPNLAVDRFIEELRAGDLPGAKLLSSARERGIGDLCFEARKWTMLAVIRADDAVRSGVEQRIKTDDRCLEFKLRQARALRDQLEAFIGDTGDAPLRSGLFVPDVVRGTANVDDEQCDRAREKAIRAIDRIKPVLEALRDLEELAETKRALIKPDRRGTHWAIDFAEMHGYLWHAWTGGDRKTRTGQGKLGRENWEHLGFVEFVEACYAGIAPTEHVCSWAGPARDAWERVKKRELKGELRNSFAKYQKRAEGDERYDPPGTTYQTPEEARSRRERAFARDNPPGKIAAREYLRLFRSSDPQQREIGLQGLDRLSADPELGPYIESLLRA
jgi:hypothetical protein